MSTKTPATTSSLVFSTLVGVLGGTISWVVRVAFGGVGMAVSCCNWVSRCSVYRVTIGSCWLTSAGTLPVTVIWINGPAANCGTTAVYGYVTPSARNCLTAWSDDTLPASMLATGSRSATDR